MNICAFSYCFLHSLCRVLLLHFILIVVLSHYWLLDIEILVSRHGLTLCYINSFKSRYNLIWLSTCGNSSAFDSQMLVLQAYVISYYWNLIYSYSLVWISGTGCHWSTYPELSFCVIPPSPVSDICLQSFLSISKLSFHFCDRVFFRAKTFKILMESNWSTFPSLDQVLVPIQELFA